MTEEKQDDTSVSKNNTPMLPIGADGKPEFLNVKHIFVQNNSAEDTMSDPLYPNVPYYSKTFAPGKEIRVRGAFPLDGYPMKTQVPVEIPIAREEDEHSESPSK